jgi:hypothetical protein
MRIRTIVAAAAAPAALVGVLLGTAGQASAATTAAPAVLTASVQHAPHAITAVTYRTGVEDTTTAQTANLDPVYGYVWAHDYMAFTVTAAPVTGSPGTWDITIHENGVYAATANPITGRPWNHTGAFGGWLTYQVTTAGTPSPRNLPAVEPGTAHTSDILTQLFGGAALTRTGSASDGQYSFTYYGVQGAPGGVYTQP